jgi:hypothetical protein
MKPIFQKKLFSARITLS